MSDDTLNEKRTIYDEPISPIEDDRQESSTKPDTVGNTTKTQHSSSAISEVAPKRSSRSTSRVRFEEDEGAPERPPRPMTPRQQAEITLIEAFPTIDAKVIKAVLAASGGQVEPAFNALLGMSDPDFSAETPPPKPLRPTPNQQQVAQDELYARQLADQYYDRADRHVPRRGPPQQQQQQQQQRRPQGEKDYKEYNFFDDELPEIRENLRQGFVQTQNTVNKWITTFKKRLDGEDEEDAPITGRSNDGQRQNFGPSQSEQVRGILRRADSSRTRRSTDHDRYDADPRVLSSDFSELELRDEASPPKKPARPLANPNLFKPTPLPPQSGPVDEVDALYHPATASSPSHTGSSSGAAASAARQLSPGAPGSGAKSKKWQPLTSVTPALEAEVDDDDPFLLGDSDDDAKKVDVNEEAAERLKRAAKQSGGEKSDAGLEEHERSGPLGLQDKTAEDLLNR